jgi:hypothetical protein
MRLTWRDGLATVFVFVAVLLYVSWLTGMEVLGTSSARIVGGVVLGLGLAASVTAVVYGVGAGLFRASKAYLAIASMIGLAALVAGVIALVSGNEMMLGALVFATAALWAMSTVRHMLETRTGVEDEQGDLSFRDAA